jgi:hypothetical protein
MFAVRKEVPIANSQVGWRMDGNLAIICVLTFIIHLIGTLAYSVRIAV